MEIRGGTSAADEMLRVPGIDAWVFSQPHRGEADGGDIHYLSMCGGGRISRFFVADVAGHGQTVSQVAGDLRSLMRRHINTLDGSRFARSLNEEFGELADEGVFATALLATYFAPTDQLVMCNAGHPRPLWYQAAAGQWRTLEHDIADRDNRARNLPLGVIGQTGYHQFAVTLGQGDIVLLYTDALIEARNAEGRPLNEIGLLGLARSLDPADPRAFGRALLERIGEFRGLAEPDDDLTLVALYHNAESPPRRSMGELLTVMAKMVGLAEV